MSSIYFWSLHSLCPNHFQYGKIDMASVINSSAIMFFNISHQPLCFQLSSLPWEAIWCLNSKNMSGLFFFFFPKMKLCTSLQQTPKESLHTLTLWKHERAYPLERGITSLSLTYMCLRVRTLHMVVPEEKLMW